MLKATTSYFRMSPWPCVSTAAQPTRRRLQGMCSRRVWGRQTTDNFSHHHHTPTNTQGLARLSAFREDGGSRAMDTKDARYSHLEFATRLLTGTSRPDSPPCSSSTTWEPAHSNHHRYSFRLLNDRIARSSILVKAVVDIALHW